MSLLLGPLFAEGHDALPHRDHLLAHRMSSCHKTDLWVDFAVPDSRNEASEAWSVAVVAISGKLLVLTLVSVRM